MIGRLSMALFVAMMLTIQPVFAQDVIILDLGIATDEELAGALDAATELELVMRTDWEIVDAYDEPLPAEEAAEPEYIAEYPEAVEAAEPEYVAEYPEAVEAAEPEYVAEYLEAVEAAEPEYVAEYPEAVEAAEPEYVAEYPEAVEAVEQEYVAEYPEAVEAAELEYVAEYPEAVEVAEPEYVAVAEEAPEDVLENRYLLESQRLVRLAEEAYEQGDYEAATVYAQEASRYAQLSDEYIAAQQVEAVAVAEEGYPLPATFTVRSWAVYRDCLWNIAALPEIYGDPYRWPILFNANRHRMPDPNNPDLILPGMVLEITSIDGEAREGAWQSGRVYRSR